MQRDDAIKQLQSDTENFDILIVGGGATGLGAAVDAVTRGYRVALIEQADFGSGTSSRSTKLVHGGVRYMAQGDISLVMSALRERGHLLRNAPHLVHVMPFVIPNYSWWEGPYYRLGMALYDRLAGRWSFGRSRRLSRRETLEHLPTVETTGLAGGVLYFDGQFDDARLAITLVLTAEQKGAVLANYCRCVGLLKEEGIVAGVLAKDGETGVEFPIRARTVINATGVFVDEVRRFDEPRVESLVTVSQGVHVVLPRSFLPGSTALMIPRTADGRVLFAIPWHGRVVVGTTDTPGVGPSLEPRAQPAELDFVMQHARRYLTKYPGPRDVLSVFTGLRPLVSRRGGPTAALSRDHTIMVSASRLISITGGKWTTYRKMAEDVIDFAERQAGREHRPSPTAGLLLHGAGGELPSAPHLAVYGCDAAAISTLARHVPGLREQLHPLLPYTQAEVVWQARHEMARTVEDVLARRTRALVLDASASMEAAPLVARLLAAELHRDEAWIATQVRTYFKFAETWLMPGVERPPRSPYAVGCPTGRNLVDRNP